MRRELPERKLVRLWGRVGLVVGGLFPYGLSYLHDPSLDSPPALWALVVIFVLLSIPFAFLFRWCVGLLFEVAWHCDEQAFFCGVLGGLIGAGAGLLPYLPLSPSSLHPRFFHVFLLVVTLCVLFECLGMQLVRGFKRIEVNEVFDEK